MPTVIERFAENRGFFDITQNVRWNDSDDLANHFAGIENSDREVHRRQPGLTGLLFRKIIRDGHDLCGPAFGVVCQRDHFRGSRVADPLAYDIVGNFLGE
jgi:hypothetical protein